MFEGLLKIWKIKDLRKSIFFVLFILVIFRIAAHIPMPGINVANLKEFFQSNQILGLLNMLSGGGMERFSVVALGIGPYITASIIFQLLTMIIPALEELTKEGESGRQRLNQYTRIATVPLAILQGYAMIILLSRAQQQILPSLDFFRIATMIITMVAGTMFLVWLGELISEKKVGNGISLLIFAGIVVDYPAMVQRTIMVFDPSQIINLIIFIALMIATVIGIVFVGEAQRNIPVSYAKRIRGMRMYGGTDTYLPLRINQVGMIPIIFAISFILFPPLVAQFLTRVKYIWIQNFAHFIIQLFQNQVFYAGIYFVLVVAFTYFYTSIVFHPQQIAENLQKQGGFIPGIRPGKSTGEYLTNVSNRIMLAGAFSLGAIAILPLIIQPILGITTIAISGASLIIIVSVVIETIKQIESQMTMREYEGL
ncbi:MAG: preprotein translocase subunit SecY [Parcubacteria group bacterium Athens1014_10]|nr:MAG: preprotein translocase subunit SecY [Parcubacteria group bacterium Athens1014_10]TSD05480.1 MAG: preprotein translocase subunit SecY [Parcubacteria group bacterium Athens0714_12]